MEVSDQLHALATFPTGNSPSTHWIGGYVGPWAGLGVFEMRKISCPCQIQTLYCLAHSTVTILAKLSWLLLFQQFHHKYIFNCSVAAWSGYTHMVIGVTQQKQSAAKRSGKWGGKCHISQARNGQPCKNFTVIDSYSLLQFNKLPHLDQTHGICYLCVCVCVCVCACACACTHAHDTLESPPGNVLQCPATLLP